MAVASPLTAPKQTYAQVAQQTITTTTQRLPGGTAPYKAPLPAPVQITRAGAPIATAGTSYVYAPAPSAPAPKPTYRIEKPAPVSFQEVGGVIRPRWIGEKDIQRFRRESQKSDIQLEKDIKRNKQLALEGLERGLKGTEKFERLQKQGGKEAIDKYVGELKQHGEQTTLHNIATETHNKETIALEEERKNIDPTNEAQVKEFNSRVQENINEGNALKKEELFLTTQAGKLKDKPEAERLSLMVEASTQSQTGIKQYEEYSGRSSQTQYDVIEFLKTDEAQKKYPKAAEWIGVKVKKEAEEMRSLPQLTITSVAGGIALAAVEPVPHPALKIGVFGVGAISAGASQYLSSLAYEHTRGSPQAATIVGLAALPITAYGASRGIGYAITKLSAPKIDFVGPVKEFGLYEPRPTGAYAETTAAGEVKIKYPVLPERTFKFEVPTKAQAGTIVGEPIEEVLSMAKMKYPSEYAMRVIGGDGGETKELFKPLTWRALGEITAKEMPKGAETTFGAGKTSIVMPERPIGFPKLPEAIKVAALRERPLGAFYAHPTLLIEEYPKGIARTTGAFKGTAVEYVKVGGKEPMIAEGSFRRFFDIEGAPGKETAKLRTIVDTKYKTLGGKETPISFRVETEFLPKKYAERAGITEPSKIGIPELRASVLREMRKPPIAGAQAEAEVEVLVSKQAARELIKIPAPTKEVSQMARLAEIQFGKEAMLTRQIPIALPKLKGVEAEGVKGKEIISIKEKGITILKPKEIEKIKPPRLLPSQRTAEISILKPAETFRAKSAIVSIPKIAEVTAVKTKTITIAEPISPTTPSPFSPSVPFVPFALPAFGELGGKPFTFGAPAMRAEKPIRKKLLIEFEASPISRIFFGAKAVKATPKALAAYKATIAQRGYIFGALTAPTIEGSPHLAKKAKKPRGMLGFGLLPKLFRGRKR